jgi:hypothetical protein
MSDLIWKVIKDYEQYSVSTNGSIKNNTTGRILKHYIRNGYKSITLSKDSKKKTYNIHTIIASHFLKKPDGVFVVNHKNENKLDNTIENLEYVTYAENTQYSASSKRTSNNAEFDLSVFSQIPNYTNYMISTNGEVYSTVIKRLCSISILPNGYHKIKLKSDMDVYKDLYIHVLVAMTYLQYIPSTNKIVINHIDGNKGNNQLFNLEIITQKENMQHSVQINKNKIFRRSVYYMNDKNERIQFVSAKEAYIATNIDNSSILKSCKSDKKAGGIKWHYSI